MLLGSAMLPGSTDAADDEGRRRARKDAGVSAILHSGYPVRFWDHDLGPDRTRLVVGAQPVDADDPDEPLELRDLTGHVGAALDEASWHLSADGRTAVTTWAVPDPGASQRPDLVAIDVAPVSGGRCSTTRRTSSTRRGCPRTAPRCGRRPGADPRPTEPIDVGLVVVAGRRR